MRGAVGWLGGAKILCLALHPGDDLLHLPVIKQTLQLFAQDMSLRRLFAFQRTGHIEEPLVGVVKIQNPLIGQLMLLRERINPCPAIADVPHHRRLPEATTISLPEPPSDQRPTHPPSSPHTC